MKLQAHNLLEAEALWREIEGSHRNALFRDDERCMDHDHFWCLDCLKRAEKVRKKARQWRQDNFRKYSGERGNPGQWQQAATGVTLEKSDVADALARLGLRKLPKDKLGLHKAWRSAMWNNHPDRGGSKAEAQKANAAYEKLKELYV